MNTTSEASTIVLNNTTTPANFTSGDPIAEIHPKAHLFSIDFPTACLWFFVLVFCMYKPRVPEERRRRVRPQAVEESPEEDVDAAEAREKLIKESLITKRVVSSGDSTMVELQDVEETDESRDASTPQHECKSAPIPSGLGTDDEVACMICLEPFLERETVSWSKLMNCRHVFHHECVSEWLMNSDECPCCRCEYIKSESQEEPQEKTATEEGVEYSGTVGGFFIVDGLISRVRSAGYALVRLPSVGDRRESTNTEPDAELVESGGSSTGSDDFVESAKGTPATSSPNEEPWLPDQKRKQVRSRLQLFPRRSSAVYRLAEQNESLEEAVCQDGSPIDVESGSYQSLSYLADQQNSLGESCESNDSDGDSSPEKKESQLSPRCVVEV